MQCSRSAGEESGITCLSKRMSSRHGKRGCADCERVKRNAINNRSARINVCYKINKYRLTSELNWHKSLLQLRGKETAVGSEERPAANVIDSGKNLRHILLTYKLFALHVFTKFHKPHSDGLNASLYKLILLVIKINLLYILTNISIVFTFSFH